MDKSLPIYELLIDENPESESEVNFVALVDSPAIERNFLAFNENTNPFAFAAVDDEQRIVFGPAMIPDMPIYRADENGEYQVVFSKDTIKSIALKFFEKGYQQNVNLMHDAGQQVEGVTFFVSALKDKVRGIEVMTDDLPDGTWYLGAYVRPDEVWADIKAGKFKGFSVEGLFKYKKQKMSAEAKLKAIEQLLQDID
jgi:hypothetical protein